MVKTTKQKQLAVESVFWLHLRPNMTVLCCHSCGFAGHDYGSLFWSVHSAHLTLSYLTQPLVLEQKIWRSSSPQPITSALPRPGTLGCATEPALQDLWAARPGPHTAHTTGQSQPMSVTPTDGLSWNWSHSLAGELEQEEAFVFLDLVHIFSLSRGYRRRTILTCVKHAWRFLDWEYS